MKKLLFLLLSTTAAFGQGKPDSTTVMPSKENDGLPQKKISYSGGRVVLIEYLDSLGTVEKSISFDKHGRQKNKIEVFPKGTSTVTFYNNGKKWIHYADTGKNEVTDTYFNRNGAKDREEKFYQGIQRTTHFYFEEKAKKMQFDSAGQRLLSVKCDLDGHPTGKTAYHTPYLRLIPIDTESWASLDPRRPFVCGKPVTFQECIDDYKKYVKLLGLQKGDIVGDVGASNGFYEGIFSVLCDSITFYIQDIDTLTLNWKEFDKVINYFSGIKNGPQTNKFHLVIGTEKKTNLPDGIFDKIIIKNTFHEFSSPDEMLDDIINKLKPDGKLIIDDTFSRKDKIRRHAGCYEKDYKVEKLVELMAAHGLYLTKMQEPENFSKNILHFEKAKGKSEDFRKIKSKIDPYILLAETLADPVVSTDSLKTKEIANTLLLHRDSLVLYYKNFETFISEIVSELKEMKKYKAAVNVCKLNLRLFPKSADAHYDLANAYHLLGERTSDVEICALALPFYEKSLDLDSTFLNVAADIKAVNGLIDNEGYAPDTTAPADSMAPYPRPKWPYFGPDIPPYIAVTGGYERTLADNLTAGVALNAFTITGDPSYGGMAGGIFSYKQDLTNKNILSYDFDFGFWGAISLGAGYSRNKTESYSIGGFKPFIGVSLYHFQLIYGYCFYKEKKDPDRAFSHNRITFRYVIPLFKLSK